MKPLTIEELKALQVGDWAWITDNYGQCGHYAEIGDCIAGGKNHLFLVYNTYNENFYYSDYGTKWLAYKNKEQAEGGDERFTRKDSTYYEKALAKLQEIENKIESGQLIKLPCIRKINNKPIPLHEVVYVQISGTIGSETYPDEKQAEARLQELRGEK